MAFRVNSEGTRLDKNGKEIGKVGEFEAAVNKAWAANKPGDSNGPGKDQCIMIVEDGDCQWNIAEDAAGADPVETAYGMNKQHKNPDLIHKGDVVFVDRTVRYAEDKHGDNTALFADQVKADSDAAVMAGKGSPQAENAMWGAFTPQEGLTGLRRDAYNYFSETPEDKRDDLLVKMAAENPSEAGRAALYEGYLLSFPDQQKRNQAAARLKADHYPKTKDEPQPAHAEIDKALKAADAIWAQANKAAA
jgi:hypothetical protein